MNLIIVNYLLCSFLYFYIVIFWENSIDFIEKDLNFLGYLSICDNFFFEIARRKKK